jgi:ribosomal protein S20
MITDEQRVTLLWAAREVEEAIKTGDTKRAKELIAAQHAIIEEAWQRTVQAGGNAA